MTLGGKARRCIHERPMGPKLAAWGAPEAWSRVSLRPWILGAVALKVMTFGGKAWRCIPFKKKTREKKETDDVGWQALALHPAKSPKN